MFVKNIIFLFSFVSFCISTTQTGENQKKGNQNCPTFLQQCRENNKILKYDLIQTKKNLEMEQNNSLRDLSDCNDEQYHQEQKLEDCYQKLTSSQSLCILKNMSQVEPKPNSYDNTNTSIFLVSTLAISLLVMKIFKPIFAKKPHKPHQETNSAAIDIQI